MLNNNFIDDIENISIQFHFGDCKILENIDKDWSYFYSKFKINDIEYKEENQTEVKFYKLSLMGQEFWGFVLDSLFDEIFIGKIITIGDGKTAFKIVDIGFFDVGEPFASDRVYLQVAKDGMMPPMENSDAFFKEIGERFDGVEGVRIGSWQVIDSVENEKLRVKNEKLEGENEKLKSDFLDLKESFRSLEKSIEDARLQNDLAELDKIEKELSEATKSVEIVERKEIKKESIFNDNKDYLIWSGENFKDFGVDFSEIESFEEAIERVKEKKLANLGFLEEIKFFPKALSPKGEFETKLEFQKREKIFEIEKKKFQNDYQKARKPILETLEKEIKNSKSDILNSWLGKQKIKMNYNSEIEKFDISISNNLLYFEFQIKVPKEIAQSFKRNIKNFECICQYNKKKLRIMSIRKTFQNKVFETKVNFDVSKLIEELRRYTVTIDGLMYQNQLFSKKYTWEEAKECAKNFRLGGYSDWRLPTKDELKRLLTSSKNKGINGKYYIRQEFINNIESIAWFWSLTEKDSFNAWYVGFKYNSVYWDNKFYDNYALCVREQ